MLETGTKYFFCISLLLITDGLDSEEGGEGLWGLEDVCTDEGVFWAKESMSEALKEASLSLNIFMGL